jgi:multiple sugar transport system substrate-binding protein
MAKKLSLRSQPPSRGRRPGDGAQSGYTFLCNKKLVLLLLVVAMLLAACGGGQEETLTPTPAEPVTIVFAHTGAGTRDPLQPYRELVNRFQEAHPHITVELKRPELRAGVTMKDIAGDADCFSWGSSFREPENLAAILDLGPFLEADLTLPVDDFFPSLLKQFTLQGQLWGLPNQAMPEVIKYNRDLFDAAGVKYPAVDWTTDDFTKAAIALTWGAGEEKQYGFVGTPFDFYELMLLLERRGARLVDGSVDPPTMALNAPSAVEALRWYASLSTDYGVKPVLGTDLKELVTSTSSIMRERSTLIDGSRAAMWVISESWELFSDPEGLNVGVATLPAGPDGIAGAYRSVSGYFISSHTQARQVCWEWIVYLTGQPEAIRGAPARRSVVESEAFRQKVGPARAAVYEASVAADRPPSFQFFSEQAWSVAAMLWLVQAHGQVLEGEASVEKALEVAQQSFDDFQACAIARDVGSDEEGLQACLIEVDPTLASLFSQ